MPTGSAINRASTCEAPITASVTGMRCRISVSTSMRLTKEKPQSPLSMLVSQCQ